MRPRGFTLIELLIVVALLGILSAIIVPTMRSHQDEAVASALAANVDRMSMRIEFEHQKDDAGNWPADIDPEWFASKTLPLHPEAFPGVPMVETVAQPGSDHPRNKLIVPGSQGAYWYNAAEGVVRARVTFKGDEAATIDFYNLVNDSETAAPKAPAAGSKSLAPR